jgi:hypothetical protein
MQKLLAEAALCDVFLNQSEYRRGRQCVEQLLGWLYARVAA